MDGANEVASFIESVGVPVATALGLGGALWWLIKYVLGSIVQKITEAQSQTEADIKELRQILISLIDKNQLLANDLIRLDTMIRVKWEIKPDEKRIGRNPNNKVKLMEKLNELLIAAVGIIGGFIAFIIKRLHRSVDKAHARINVLEINLVDRPYLESQLAPIRQDLNLILKHLLEKK